MVCPFFFHVNGIIHAHFCSHRENYSMRCGYDKDENRCPLENDNVLIKRSDRFMKQLDMMVAKYGVISKIK